MKVQNQALVLEEEYEVSGAASGLLLAPAAACLPPSMFFQV